MSFDLELQKVDSRDPMPKYLQARGILIDAIRSGRLSPGTKLPSTKEISSLFDISLITAHRALEGLVESGWLRREVGRGTYVRDDVDPAHQAQRQLAIGLMLDACVNIDDFYHSTIITGLRREAHAERRRIEFFFHDGFDLRGKSKRDIGAICIHPPIEAQAQVERLARGHAVIILGGAFAGTRIPSVDCDNELGGRMAVRHLVGLGHRRLMVLSGPTNLSNARDRVRGAMLELAAHGIELPDGDLPESKDSVLLDEETRAFVERRLLDPSGPTAVIAGGFYLALAVMQVARGAGLRVPADVSIVGFDDPPSAPLLDPPLTTVRQPLEEMAAQGCRLICQALADRRGISESCVLPTELVVRSSTGPPRAVSSAP